MTKKTIDEGMRFPLGTSIIAVTKKGRVHKE